MHYIRVINHSINKNNCTIQFTTHTLCISIAYYISLIIYILGILFENNVTINIKKILMCKNIAVIKYNTLHIQRNLIII